MLTLILIYMPLALSLLGLLSLMILRISQMVGSCSDSRRAAETAGVTIAIGFASIGAGGVVLIGAAIPVLAEMSIAGVMLALGLASMCLGLGFSHAVATLRAVAQPPAQSV